MGEKERGQVRLPICENRVLAITAEKNRLVTKKPTIQLPRHVEDSVAEVWFVCYSPLIPRGKTELMLQARCTF